MPHITLNSPQTLHPSQESPEPKKWLPCPKDLSLKTLISNRPGCSLYRAYSFEDDSELVIKIYNCDTVSAKMKFIMESRFDNIDHPHIIKMYGSQAKSGMFQDHDATLMMEYAPYGELTDYLNDDQLPSSEVLVRTYFHQLIKGLEYLHNNGIAHMDIKPQNILIGNGYLLKIADFDGAYKNDDIIIVSKGTKNYRPLEQRKNCVKNPYAADIYSAGVTLFSMMFGYIPYLEQENVKGVDFYDLMTKDIEKFFKVHSFMNPNVKVSKEFQELFRMMVKEDPIERITISEIKQSTWFRGQVLNLEELKIVMKSLEKKRILLEEE